tara:strand:+ start:356 stop:598 length:243 start_codon:yes stop_codon:yes gene_type:complete
MSNLFLLEEFIREALLDEAEKGHHPNYDAPKGSKRDKHLDACKAKLKRADKLEKEGKKADAEKLRQSVYDARAKEEKKYQ